MPRNSTKVDDLRPGDTIRGTVHECPHCATWFIARADAVFCCDACRKAESRKEKP